MGQPLVLTDASSIVHKVWASCAEDVSEPDNYSVNKVERPNNETPPRSIAQLFGIVYIEAFGICRK